MSAVAGREPPAAGMYRAALYMRLSRDDDGPAESASIATQRKILRAYAAENGYHIAGEYVDDGWSGTSFDRPGFKRMLADIEAKKINMVITKDLSRLGRDYIAAGQYTELYFPERGIRYIAVNDAYDSAGPWDDVAPFKHVINEMYARDASRKIRSALRAKMREGSFIGSFAPYGYKKDGENKNRLVMDYETAPVVREIFEMAADGRRPSEIAARLNQGGITAPAAQRRLARSQPDPDGRAARGEWTSSTICRLLANPVYLGHTAQGKTSKPTFKSKTALRKPREEWCVVENTHEPIVSRETFELVRKRSVSRRSAPKTGFQNVFSGLAKCADCGGNMSITGSRKKDSPYNLVCGRYKLYGRSECSNHFIDYGLLYACVLEQARELLTLSAREKRQILADMEKSRRVGEAVGGRPTRALEARRDGIDALIRRLYEDNASGKIGDERFAKLTASYEAEQRELTKKIGMLKKNDDRERAASASRRQLSEALDALADVGALTPGLVKRLIDRIEIGQGEFEQTPQGRKKRQTVRVFWRFAVYTTEQ